MAVWHDYLDQAGAGEHTVTGDIKMLPQVWSPQLENRRSILVYLPPAYGAGEQRYPVLYMHDGQNLFDKASSYAGEWGVDETLEMLSAEGLAAIVVGIANMGNLRLAEYTPFEDMVAGGGQGDLYLDFIVDNVKPLIDADFRTLPEPVHTGIAGSSLGGLISLYALFRRPEVFGLCAALSPALAGADNQIFGYIEKADPVGGKIYLDVGTREAGQAGAAGDAAVDWSQAYLDSVRAMYRLLLSKGYHTGADLLYVEDEGGLHHESAWARRLPDALRFLFR